MGDNRIHYFTILSVQKRKLVFSNMILRVSRIQLFGVTEIPVIYHVANSFTEFMEIVK